MTTCSSVSVSLREQISASKLRLQMLPFVEWFCNKYELSHDAVKEIVLCITSS